MLRHGFPQPLEETLRALHAALGPLQGQFRRRREHHEQAHGVGAVLSTRACGSTPLFLDLDMVPRPSYCTGLAIGLEHRTADAAIRIMFEFHFIGAVIVDAASHGLAQEDMVQHHALGQQVGERLVELHSSMSRITLVQKREYSRCRMACSMPPMYWSTGSQ